MPCCICVSVGTVNAAFSLLSQRRAPSSQLFVLLRSLCWRWTWRRMACHHITLTFPQFHCCGVPASFLLAECETPPSITNGAFNSCPSGLAGGVSGPTNCTGTCNADYAPDSSLPQGGVPSAVCKDSGSWEVTGGCLRGEWRVDCASGPFLPPSLAHCGTHEAYAGMQTRVASCCSHFIPLTFFLVLVLVLLVGREGWRCLVASQCTFWLWVGVRPCISERSNTTSSRKEHAQRTTSAHISAHVLFMPPLVLSPSCVYLSFFLLSIAPESAGVYAHSVSDKPYASLTPCFIPSACFSQSALQSTLTTAPPLSAETTWRGATV